MRGRSAPEGALLVMDYRSHEDEQLRERQADLWLGFSPEELTRFASEAGLQDISTYVIPASRCGGGPDGHLDWQLTVARRA